MRRLVGCLLLFLGAGGLASADEHAPSTPSPAQEVVAAWREGSTWQLVALARRDAPDPWTVADEILRLGAPEAALAFARAAVRPDTARLAAYVERRGSDAPHAPIRAALEAAGRVESPEAAPMALAAIEAELGHGDPYEQVLVAESRGGLLEILARRGEAAEALFAAGRIAGRLGWFAKAVDVYHRAGELAYQDGDPEAALTAWSGELAVEQGRANDAGAARALMFVGLAHVARGDYGKALGSLREAASAHEALENEDGVAWVLDNEAVVHLRRGEWQRAQSVLDRALAIARRVGNRFREASVLAGLGTVYGELRDPVRARAALVQALALHRELEDEEGLNECLSTLAWLRYTEGDYDGAIAMYEKSLDWYRKRNDALSACGCLNNIAYAWLRKGDLPRAQALAEQAVREAEDIGDLWCLSNNRQSLGDVLVARKAYREAERQFDRSLQDAGRLEAPALLVAAHRGLAELWLAQGQFPRAVHESKRALAQVQAMLAGLAQDQAVTAREQAARLYDVAIRAAVGWGQAEAIFSALESARSGALLEVLENREDLREATIPEALREDLREARLEALTALRRYQQAVQEGELRAMRQRRAEMERAQAKVDAAVGQIQVQAKSGASVLYPEAASLEEVQAELTPTDVLVLYSLAGEEALAFVVERDATKVVSLGPRDALVLAADARPEDPATDWSAMGRALRQKLIEPLALPEAAARLLVAPDGILGFVPFALLAPEQEVVYVPSGTAYRVLRQEGGKHGRGVLALGDPDYRPGPGDGAEIAQRGGMHLAPLPASRAEAEAIGDVVLLGAEATRTGLLKALDERTRWRAVHLACHGLVDPSRPMDSALALAFEADGTNLLRCEEVYGRRIEADLTVLSACETGKGAVYRSEGIVGLTQAFMVAGSPRVLVSLWKVDDAATQALMLKFYELWRSDEHVLSASQALRGAQAYVRAQPQWQHPYYWGAWVLWGLPD